MQNIKLFQDRDNIKMVMKDGVYYKGGTGRGAVAADQASAKSVWEQ